MVEYTIMNTLIDDNLLVIIRDPNIKFDLLGVVNEVKAITPLNIDVVEYDYKFDSYFCYGVYEGIDIMLTITNFHVSQLNSNSTTSIWIEVLS